MKTLNDNEVCSESEDSPLKGFIFSVLIHMMSMICDATDNLEASPDTVFSTSVANSYKNGFTTKQASEIQRLNFYEYTCI